MPAVTFAPVLVFALQDHDLPKGELAQRPDLYTAGIRRTAFSLTGFWLWTADALFVSVVATYVPIWGMVGTIASGTDAGAYMLLSWVSTHIITWGVLMRFVPEIHSWTFLEHLAVWGSLLLFELFMLLTSVTFMPHFSSQQGSILGWANYYHFMAETYANPQFWLCWVLGVWLYVMPVLIGKSYNAVTPAVEAAAAAETPKTPGAFDGLEMPTSGTNHTPSAVPRATSGLSRATSERSMQVARAEQRRSIRMMAQPTAEEMLQYREAKTGVWDVASKSAHATAHATGQGLQAVGAMFVRPFTFSINQATSIVQFEQSVVRCRKRKDTT